MEDEHYVFVPPDGGWGWVIVAATFMNNFLLDGTIYSAGMFVNTFVKEFKTTVTQVSIIAAINSGWYSIGGPFVSALVNRFGFRTIGFIGATVAAVSYACVSFAQNLLTVIILNGLMGGIFLSLLYAPTCIIIGFYFERWRALANGISTSGSGFGVLCLPIIIQICLETKTWRFAFIILGANLSLAAVLSLLYRPLKPVKIKEKGGTQVKPEVKVEDKSIKPDATKHGLCWKLCSCCSGPQSADAHVPRITDVVDEEKIMFETEYEDSDSDILEEDANIPEASSLSVTHMNKGQKSLISNISRYIWGENLRGWPRCKRRWRRFWRCYYCRQHQRKTGPLNRDDIFFSNSLYLLPAYRESALKSSALKRPGKHKGKLDNVSYHMSVTRIRTARQACCPMCNESVKTLLNCTLLKNPSFLMFMSCGFFSYIGWVVPFMYIKDRAASVGIKNGNWLISAIGLSNTIGRLCSGALPSLTKTLSVTSYVIIMIFIHGITLLVSGLKFFMNFPAQITFAALFGFCGAWIGTLRPVIIVELYGLEQLTNAIGLNMGCYGLGASLGTLIGGALCDYEGNYYYCFYFAGACMVLSSICLIPVKRVRVREIKKETAKRMQKKSRHRHHT